MAISIGTALFILVVLGISFVLTKGATSTNVKSVSTDSHHAEQASQEESIFNALLGKTAPDFTLYNYNGEKVSLSEQRGKKVVLFFTEGVMCYPSCWNQIAAFGRDEALKGKETIVLNIVVDTKNEWDKAMDKMPEMAAATILFDSAKNVSKTYGVLALPSSMHRGQFPGHSYLIVDKEGTVRFIKDDPQMAVRNDELKAQLAKLN